MMKTYACIIARTTSSRLPLKVLRDCGYGYGILELLIRRLKSVSKIDEIFICTSSHPVDDIMEDIAHKAEVKLYRGSEQSVIDRMIDVGKLTNADALVRITGDNPLTSVEYLDQQIDFMYQKELDYVRLIDVPLGATAEVIRRSALEDLHRSMDPSISEYMMLFLYEPKKYKCGLLKPFLQDYSSYSVTVDTKEDLTRLKATCSNFVEFGDNPAALTLSEIMRFYQSGVELPGAQVLPAGEVKMPYGKSITFEAFKHDMDRRQSQSNQLNLF